MVAPVDEYSGIVYGSRMVAGLAERASSAGHDTSLRSRGSDGDGDIRSRMQEKEVRLCPRPEAACPGGARVKSSERVWLAGVASDQGDSTGEERVVAEGRPAASTPAEPPGLLLFPARLRQSATKPGFGLRVGGASSGAQGEAEQGGASVCGRGLQEGSVLRGSSCCCEQQAVLRNIGGAAQVPGHGGGR